jgi:hypothetical protein
MKRFVTLIITALLFIMPTFSETWVYENFETESGYLYNVYAYDTEDDFIKSREQNVIKETGCYEHQVKSLFRDGKAFQKCGVTKDTESLIKILKEGNYAYVMITFEEGLLTYAQVFKLVNNTLYAKVNSCL